MPALWDGVMLTADDLSGMREVQEDAMMDTCVLLSYGVGAVNAYGKKPLTWTPGVPLSCGVRYMKAGQFGSGVASAEGMDEIGLFTTLIRLPLDTALDVRDRIRVTHRFGEALDETIMYEVLGEPRRGPTCLSVDVRKVTDGS